jgi:adenosylcobinamide-phosphate synthase
MGFVALILALLIEQGRPLPTDNPAYNVVRWLASSVRTSTDAGAARFGTLGWFIVVGVLVVAAGALHWVCARVHPVALFLLHLGVLYLTVGFRQFSNSFSQIQQLLNKGEIDAARNALQDWLRLTDPELSLGPINRHEICRLAISTALIQAHRHVFAPLFWYMLLPGPIGPVLYRAAEYLARLWQDKAEPYTHFARKAYYYLDWLPLRLAMAGFAIVGNFEDAVYCWRGATMANNNGEDTQRSLLLAAGSGALGLRIADPVMEAQWGGVNDKNVDIQSDNETRFEWTGAEPDANGLNSAVGLVWRAVLLWIFLFAMLTMATWLGA